MTEPRRPTTNLLEFLPSLAHRAGYVFLVCAVIALIILDKADNRAVEGIRTGVTDVVTPVMDGLSRPITTVADAVRSINSYFDVHGENVRLREENRQLRQWRDAAQVLSSENRAFRDMLAYVPEKGVSSVGARVIADTGGVFARSILINAGTKMGLDKGNPVVNGHGLVGRVVEAGRRSARVLLITDLNSRIPVITEKGRKRGILSGSNDSMLKLIFQGRQVRPAPGMAIVTSGHGDVFPVGLQVGRIAYSEDSEVFLQPYANFDRLEFVRVITGFPGKGAGRLVKPEATAGQ